jgi:peroxiredoxin
MRAVPHLIAVALLLAAPAKSDDGDVYKWVDKDGNIHITTDPPPAGAKTAPPPPAASSVLIYEWQGADGRFYVTTSPPPKGATLLSKGPWQHGPEAGGEAAPPVPKATPGAFSIADLRSPRVVGSRAPDLDAVDAHGDDFDLVALRGRPVWLTFATRHSPHCAATAKTMSKLAKGSAPPELVFVLGADENVERARAWAERYDLDPERVLAGHPDIFPMGAVPHHIFIDRSGRIVEVRSGRLSEDVARRILKRLK